MMSSHCLITCHRLLNSNRKELVDDEVEDIKQSGFNDNSTCYEVPLEALALLNPKSGRFNHRFIMT